MQMTTLCLIAASFLATSEAYAQVQGIAGSSHQTAARGGNDDCANCTPLAGPGTYSFDNTAASMDGVADPLCDFFGTQEIDFDVWFCYTAASTATATVSACNQTTVDTKIAAYDGGCGSPILGCNDDACGLQSELTFPVTAGNSYLLRVGTFPGASGGPGSITITEGGGGGGSGNDDCANATPLSGDGVFAVDNTGGTGLDADPGCGSASADVWYEWTAAATGTVVMDLCDGTTLHDSIMAIWDGSGCPTVLLDCNDDTCGLQSTISTPVIAGGVYMVQVAGYVGAQGAGNLTVTTLPPAQNDSCSNPDIISGEGTFNFDTTAASMDGSADVLCDAFGTQDIDFDVWYEWTATSDGTAVIETCNLTTVDTKLAAYDGSGCPVAGAIACNDDTCGLQSQIAFTAVAGQVYTLRVGTFPGASGGLGQFTISMFTPYDGYRYDDGSSDDLLGLTNGGEMAWIHSFEAEGGSDTIATIQAAWGSALWQGYGPGNGSAANVYVWDDPTNDGDPSDAVLLTSFPTTVANVDTDILNDIDIPDTAVTGTFFIGASIAHSAGQYVAPLDTGTPYGGEAWIAGEIAPAVFDPSNLGGSGVLDNMANIIPSYFLLRAVGDGGGGCVSAIYCTSLPNSTGATATINWTGSCIVADNNFTLDMSNGPSNQPGLFIYGANQASIPFGNGVLCISAPIIRLNPPVFMDGSGTAVKVVDLANPPSQTGLITAGTQWNFAMWLRDPAAGAAGYTFTDGLSVDFQ